MCPEAWHASLDSKSSRHVLAWLLQTKRETAMQDANVKTTQPFLLPLVHTLTYSVAAASSSSCSTANAQASSLLDSFLSFLVPYILSFRLWTPSMAYSWTVLDTIPFYIVCSAWDWFLAIHSRNC